MRHLGAVEILRRRRARRGAHGAEHEGDVVVLDQPPRRLDGLRRRKTVVERDHVELAPVDAALLVDGVEIGGKGLAGDAQRRGRAGIRHDIAELDFGVGDPGLLGQGDVAGAAMVRESRAAKVRLARSDHGVSSPANGRIMLALLPRTLRESARNRSCVDRLDATSRMRWDSGCGEWQRLNAS